MSEVKRIKTEGRRVDVPRNIERLWLELEAVGSGCSVEGHRVLGEVRNDDGTFSRQPSQIEIYADRLGAVLSRTRTDRDRQKYEQARESARILTDEWIEENKAAVNAKKNKEERERFIHLKCNIRPEHELARMGYRTGMPPLESCKIVHPQTYTTMDAREWQKLPADQRAEWFVEAPITPQNATQRANENLAMQIARAMSQVSAQAREERPKQK